MFSGCDNLCIFVVVSRDVRWVFVNSCFVLRDRQLIVHTTSIFSSFRVVFPVFSHSADTAITLFVRSQCVALHTRMFFIYLLHVVIFVLVDA